MSSQIQRRSPTPTTIIIVGIIVFVSTFIYLNQNTSQHQFAALHCPNPQTLTTLLPSTSTPSNTIEWWSEKPKESIVDFEINGPFDGKGLKDLCDNTQWVSKRFITCDGIEGGIGNVRNALLHCIRYTIAAGAGLVMPSIRIRGAVGPDSNNLHTGGRSGIDFMFDIPHFKKTLNDYCPALLIVDSVYNINAFEIAYMPQPLQPRDLFSRATGKAAFHSEMTNDHAPSFRRDFEVVMKDPGPTIFHKDSFREELFPHTSRPTIVRLSWPLYFEWPIAIDSISFQRNFGSILKFKSEVNYLASEIWLKLNTMDSKYFGCHLRSEADAPMAFWISAETQRKSYLEQSIAKKLTIMYVGGGDQPAFESFFSQGKAFNIQLENKYSLLSPESLIHLKALPFDQQALVDYLVLLKSEFFSGIGASSFSHNIAIKRHLNVWNFKRSGPFKGVDEFSLILGAENYAYLPLTAWA